MDFLTIFSDLKFLLDFFSKFWGFLEREKNWTFRWKVLDFFPGEFFGVLCDFFGFLGEFFLDFPPISCIVTWVTQPERPKGAQRTNPSRSKGPNDNDIMSKPAPQWGVVVVARCGRQGSLGLRLSWAVNWYIAVSLLLGWTDRWSDDQMVKWWQDRWSDGQVVAGQLTRWSDGGRTDDHHKHWQYQDHLVTGPLTDTDTDWYRYRTSGVSSEVLTAGKRLKGKQTDW